MFIIIMIIMCIDKQYTDIDINIIVLWANGPR
jgi:hypothetical protein